MKIIFMGTPDFALPTLKKLNASSHSLEAVITQPDRPRGRGRGVAPLPVKQFALDQGIPVFQPEKASAPDFVARLTETDPDLIVVIAFGQLLRENLLSVPKHFCMNVHASLLPKYRGAAPINWAILNGETETGVTTMKMDRGLDTGDMLLARSVPISDTATAQHLHDLLAETGGDLALETMTRLEQGTLDPVPQDHEAATLAPKLTKNDGWLQWDQSAKDLYNRVRGLHPWPGAFTFLQGKRLRIFRAETAPAVEGDRAGILMRVSDYGLEIGTGNGRLILTEVQPEGKKRMSAKSFIQGNPIQTGEQFDSPQNPDA